MSEQTLVERLRAPLSDDDALWTGPGGLFDEAAARIEALEADAKRFYLADDSYEECESAELCVEKRKAAAKLIAELEGDRLLWCDAVSILDEHDALPDVHDHLDKIEQLCCDTAHIKALEAIVEKLPERMASMLFVGHNIYQLNETTGREEDGTLTHRELNQVFRRLRSAAEAAKEGAATK